MRKRPPAAYQLAANQTGPFDGAPLLEARSGGYALSVEATSWPASSSVKLQYRNFADTAWVDIATLTANGMVGLNVAELARPLRLSITGAVVGVYASFNMTGEAQPSWAVVPGGTGAPLPAIANAEVEVPLATAAGTVVLSLPALATGEKREIVGPNDGRFTFNTAGSLIRGLSAISYGTVRLRIRQRRGSDFAEARVVFNVPAPVQAGTLLGSTVSRKRVVGRSGSANASSLTGVQVLQATAPVIDAVKLILHINQANLPGSAVKMTLAASAKAGRNPVLANDAAAPWTTVTWGGQSSVTVSNAAASADGGEVENAFISDLMPVPSLARADVVGALPIYHARITASTYVPLFSNGGYDPSLVEPNYISGTVSGDQTTAVLGADPINTYFHIPITWVFYHQGYRVFSVTTGGDSTM